MAAVVEYNLVLKVARGLKECFPQKHKIMDNTNLDNASSTFYCEDTELFSARFALSCLCLYFVQEVERKRGEEEEKKSSLG